MEFSHTVFVLGILLIFDGAYSEKLDIQSLHIRSDIKYRFSTTLVDSVLRNTNDEAKEATFDVRLPKSAFISNFTIEINGEIYPGIVKEKEEASRQYLAAVAQGQSAGHVVEKKSRGTTRFQVSVNVAANSDVIFKLTYQELLQRKIGVYEQVIYVDPGQTVQDLQIDVYIAESREIIKLMVPPLRNDIQNEIILNQENSLAEVERTSPNAAHIRYRPTVEQQLEDSVHGINGQFVVQYDVVRSLDAGQVEVVDGYFVHYFAPSGLEPVSKNVLFILDVSGSMHGQKIQQVRESMAVILDDLREGDFFNIITFDSDVQSWKPNMVPVNERHIEQSKDFVINMRDRGSTDIHKALSHGIDMLDREAAIGETRLASLIIFLTDGQPTAGITDTDNIIRKITALNEDKYTLFSLGYGNGVDFEFLQKLSARNRGLARKIYHDSDAALQLTGFYSEIANPVLANVHIKYLDDSVDNETLTKTIFPTYFDGSEIIVAGKLRDGSVNSIRTQITAESEEGTLELDLTINDIRFDDGPLQLEDVPSPYGLASFTERLWAYLTIKGLLAKKYQVSNDTIKETLKEKALAMSLKYNFVTPLTSMVATKPNDTDGSDIPALPRPAPEADLLPRPQVSAFFGRSGLGVQPSSHFPRFRHQNGGIRRYSPNVFNSPIGPPGLAGFRPVRLPHSTTRRPRTTTTTTARPTTTVPQVTTNSVPGVIVKVNNLTSPLCFDNKITSSRDVQLLHDRSSGDVINARLKDNAARSSRYFGKIWLKTSSFELNVTKNNVQVDNYGPRRWSRGWRKDRVYNTGGICIVEILARNASVRVRCGEGMEVMIIKEHLVDGTVYFRVSIAKGIWLSTQATGLLGHFENGRVLQNGTEGADGYVNLNLNKNGQVTRFIAQRRVIQETGDECLFVDNYGSSVLGRDYADFMVNRITQPSAARGLPTNNARRV